MFLPQLAVMLQSDWLICRCREENRQQCLHQFVTQWSRAERIFCGKRKIDSGLVWSVLISKTIFVITGVKI